MYSSTDIIGAAARSDREIDLLLSEPTPGAIEAVRQLEGDFMVLGASGKIGVTLAMMIRRALDAVGRKETRVLGVARFRNAGARAALEASGVETVSCDLSDYEAVMRLPEARNVHYLAGQKFGTDTAPGETWIENTVVPSHVARRFRTSRIVVFSTGCVYTFASVDGPGSSEDSPLGFLGEYASTCIGRERVFSHYARTNGTPMLLFRLNYAVEFRYGVLVDIAERVLSGEPLDLSMAVVNVIWQGEVCARAVQALLHVASPPKVLNISGDKVPIKVLAEKFGAAFGRPPILVGEPQNTSWHVDTSESRRLFGPAAVSLDAMVAGVAAHLAAHGRVLGKPTHFEVRDGKF